MELEISEIIRTGNSNPIAVRFENGELSDGFESKLDCRMLESEDSDRKRILAVSTDRMLYTGEVKSEDEDFLQNFLVIRNKTTNKVKLVQLDYVTLSPYLKKPKKVKNTITDRKTAIADLNKTFGSKRAKRMTEQRERMQLDVSNVKEQLEQIVAAIPSENLRPYASQVHPDEIEQSYKPPMNPNTSNVQDVYPLDKLIPPDLMPFLETEADFIIGVEEETEKLFSFCKAHLGSTRRDVNDEKGRRKEQILVYIQYLLAFLAIPAKSLNRKQFICERSKEISRHILDNFSLVVGKNRTRPFSMRDKLLCYILVLSMHVSNFQLDLEMLSKDINIGIKKLQEISRILRFTMIGAKNVALKIPLPKIKTVYGSKKKRI